MDFIDTLVSSLTYAKYVNASLNPFCAVKSGQLWRMGTLRRRQSFVAIPVIYASFSFPPIPTYKANCDYEYMRWLAWNRVLLYDAQMHDTCLFSGDAASDSRRTCSELGLKKMVTSENFSSSPSSCDTTVQYLNVWNKQRLTQMRNMDFIETLVSSITYA